MRRFGHMPIQSLLFSSIDETNSMSSRNGARKV